MRLFRVWVFLIAFVLLGAVLSVIGSALGARYVEQLRPQRATLRQAIVWPRDEHGNVKLELRFTSYPASRCVRFGAHQLSRPPESPDEGERRFLLLAGSIAGDGFVVQAQRKFTLVFDLASTVVPDTYRYSYRTFYQCGILNLVPFTDEVSTIVVIP